MLPCRASWAASVELLHDAGSSHAQCWDRPLHRMQQSLFASANWMRCCHYSAAAARAWETYTTIANFSKGSTFQEMLPYFNLSSNPNRTSIEEYRKVFK